MADFLKIIIVILVIMLVCETPPGWTKQEKKDEPEPKRKERGKWQQIKEGKYQNTYEINMWYRYAKYTALSRNHTNCYVCSKMPKSGMNPHVIPEPVIDVSGLFPECLVSAYSPQFLNMTLQNRLPPPVDIRKLTFKNFMSLPFNVSDKMYGPVHVPPSAQFICYENTVTLGDEVYLGKVPKQNCKLTFTPCTRNQTGHFRQTEANRGVVCTDYFSAPDAMGTTPQMNFVWLCGLDIYHHLPTGWRGRCAPALPTDHSFIITAKEVQHRTKRDLYEKHDSLWGTNVPNDHKLWSNGQKVGLALFPWLGTGKLMLRMETINYRFEVFLNSTISALRGIKEELSALRTMELQDRMVLDQLTASMGGVCVLIGVSCCSFVPEFDSDGQIIEQAINNLTMLRDAVEKDFVTADDLSQWLFGGLWWQRLLKICIPVLSVLILICMCLTCVMPCVVKLMKKLIQSTYSEVYLMENLAGGDYVNLSQVEVDNSEKN